MNNIDKILNEVSITYTTEEHGEVFKVESFIPGEEREKFPDIGYILGDPPTHKKIKKKLFLQRVQVGGMPLIDFIGFISEKLKADEVVNHILIKEYYEDKTLYQVWISEEYADSIRVFIPLHQRKPAPDPVVNKHKKVRYTKQNKDRRKL